MTAWTQDHLTAIEQAIARGVRRVTYADQTVEYQSVSDMLRVRDIMRAELGATTMKDNTYYAGRIA